MCEGHSEVDKIKEMIGNASLVEAGFGVTLCDMTTIVSHDIRFPAEPCVACEKLQGWSVVVDVFHGSTHPVSPSIRRAVKEIHPCLNRLAKQMGDDQGGGMDLVTRVMFDMQQDYFTWLGIRGLFVGKKLDPSKDHSVPVELQRLMCFFHSHKKPASFDAALLNLDTPV